MLQCFNQAKVVARAEWGAIEPQAWKCLSFENGRITRHIDKLVAIMVPPFDATFECFDRRQRFRASSVFRRRRRLLEGVTWLAPYDLVPPQFDTSFRVYNLQGFFSLATGQTSISSTPSHLSSGTSFGPDLFGFVTDTHYEQQHLEGMKNAPCLATGA